MSACGAGRLRRAVTLGGAVAAATALAGGVLPAKAADTATTGIKVTVDAADVIGPANPNLTGANWEDGAGTYLQALGSRFTRLDARLDLLFPKPPATGQPLGDARIDPTATANLDARLNQTFAAGLQPIAILDSPAWMACCTDPLGDGTKQPPKDPVAFERLVERAVQRFTAERVAAGEQPVRYWEVWNEPDYPSFYRGTLPQFLTNVVAPEDRAIESVSHASGLDLLFGACGCLFPDPSWMIPIFAYVRSQGLPLGFVSWHYYGNYPFVGPDGPEPLWPTIVPGQPPGFPAYNLLAYPNPAASPSSFGYGVQLVRQWAKAGLGRVPPLVLDEWNLSAAGFDRRMDTNSGAAFDAGVLSELEDAGLDISTMYAAVDPDWNNPQANPSGADQFGSWGLVTHGGTRKPAWWAFRLFADVGPQLVASTTPGSDPTVTGIRALAGTDHRKVQVLLSNWLATSDSNAVVHLSVSGLAGEHNIASIYLIDADHPSAGAPTETMPYNGVAAFVLPAQSVVLVIIGW